MNPLIFVKRMFQKHFLNFSKYTSIGILASLLNIFLIWLFIDIMDVQTLIATTVVVVLVFIIKFYSYVMVGLIHKKMFRFSVIQGISALLNIFFTWFLIDVILIPAVISSSVVVAGLFLLRYFLFYVFRIIKE